MEINTTRPAGGGLATTTMGPTALPTVAQNNPNNSASMVAIADYLKQKNAQRPQAQMQQMVPQVARPEYAPTMGTQQTSPNYAETQRRPVTRMRRVQKRSSIPIYGMEGNGLTYDEVPETMLPDGSWSLDAVHGTLAGNEAAAMKGPNDITKLVGMNFSGLGGGTWGLSPEQEKARRG